MVRLSDVLGQKGEDPESEPSRNKKEKPVRPSEEYRPKGAEDKVTEGVQISKIVTGGGEKEGKEMQVAKAMHEMQLDAEESLRIYSRALAIIKNIYDQKQENNVANFDLKEAYEIVKIIVDRLIMGDKELIYLTVDFTQDNYLYLHPVNVCILSIDTGLGLGYNKSKLHELGLGAFLHDIGMVRVTDIAKQACRLNEHDFAEIKKHPFYGSDILNTIENIQEGIIYIAKQHHERINGMGYPEGLKDNQIHEYAKLVAIVNVYEALMHFRPHREALPPHETIMELLNMNKNKVFDSKILKLLINRIGLYPAGSWVELNTCEICRVASANGDFPFRPTVNVIFSPDKEKLTQIKLVDLSKSTNIFIKRSINPQEFDFKF